MPHRRLSRRLVLAALGLVLLAVAPAVLADSRALGRPDHHLVRGYRNLDPTYDYTVLHRTVSLLRRLVKGEPDRGAAPEPVANDGVELRANGTEPTITWIGHATLLVQLDGVNILTDPQWSERASPVSWGGPRRLSAPGLAFEDLPPIHVVIISHDHYDHLDLTTVKRLADTHNPLFLVPLGMKAWFAKNGMNHVEELDWWQEREYQAVKFVCLPAQHFSQRTLWDGNKRLWASWAMLTGYRRLYFSG